MCLGKIAISIVIFKTEKAEIDSLFASIGNDNKRIWTYCVDNSPTRDPIIEATCSGRERTSYIYTGRNKGYGAGHNVVLNKVLPNRDFEYVVIVNPDVSFPVGTLEHLEKFMQESSRVVAVSPVVLNRDGTVQEVTVQRPRPVDLLRNRILGKRGRYIERARLKESDCGQKYRSTECIPGCFIFVRTSILRRVGMFDERFFMYMEDIDLSRRIVCTGYEVGILCGVTIHHGWSRESARSLRMFIIHCVSAIKYFWKWSRWGDRGVAHCR